MPLWAADEFPEPGRSLFVMATRVPRTITLAVHGPIVRGDLPGLRARICRALEEARPEVVYCDVGGVGADAATVEALARLQLAARRHGCVVRLRRASAELLDLVAYMGLSDVLAD